MRRIDLPASRYLPERVADEVTALLPAGGNSALRKLLQKQSPQLRAIHAGMYYHTQVITGGHHAYFNHSDGEFIDLVEDGFLRKLACEQTSPANPRPCGTFGLHWPDLDEDLSFRSLIPADYGQNQK